MDFEQKEREFLEPSVIEYVKLALESHREKKKLVPTSMFLGREGVSFKIFQGVFFLFQINMFCYNNINALETMSLEAPQLGKHGTYEKG